MSEMEKFLEGLGDDQNQQVDILDQPLVPEEPKTPEKDDEGKSGEGEEDDEFEFKPRNRRERRLLRTLDGERSSSRFLAEKLQTKTEAEKSLENSDYLNAIENIYGNDSPEKVAATELLKRALIGVRDDAENRAYNRMNADRVAESQQAQRQQDELDGFIDEIEDENNISLNPIQEKSFIELLTKMSRKDANGHIIAYADPHSTFEIFKERTKKKGTPTRAKELSNRSMTQTTPQGESKLEDDSTVRFLKANGII